MKHLFLSLLLLFLSVTGIQAQRTLTGTVTDAKGEPLYGVTIAVKSGKQTAVTDLNGRYSIKIDGPNAVLLFRYVGMEPYQAAVKNLLVLDVKLK